MKKVTVAVVILVLLVATSAFAASMGDYSLIGQTARTAGMGGTGIATTFDASAIGFNAANLGMLEIGYEGQRDDVWQNHAIGSTELVGDLDLRNIEWAGKPADGKWGMGASYMDFDGANVDAFSVGFGYAYTSTLSYGLSILASDGEGSVYSASATMKHPTATFGVVVDDITNATSDGPFFSAGASKQLTQEVLVAVDVRDILDEWDMSWSAGIEYTPVSAPNLAVRGGMYEGGNITLGAGWDTGVWAIDTAFTEYDFGPDNAVNVSFSYKF